MDFTITTYQNLLKSLQSAGFFFITFHEYMNGQYPAKFVILRHDVDLLPHNSLRFAKIQAALGIKGSYYFRAVPESWDERIIKEIAALGHEVGYHYENMDEASSKFKVQSSKLVPENREYDQLLDLAYNDFCENLEKLRQLVPVSTICMHGSPRSKFDNKAIWDKYDYKSLGIIGEPYYDVDFNKVFYLTDTGRRWDGWKVSVRDKVPQQELWNKQGLVFHSTQDIISAINKVKNEKRKVKNEVDSGTLNFEQFDRLTASPGTSNFPTQIMFTMHPQRWHDSIVPWTKELVMQNAKNVVKRWFLVKNEKWAVASEK